MGDMYCAGPSGFCPSEMLYNRTAGHGLGEEESVTAHFTRMLSEKEERLQEEGCG